MPDPVADDRAAIGEILDGMYAMISGPAGPRDWPRQSDYFHPEARQIRTSLDEAGQPRMEMFDPDGFRRNVTPFFDENEFYEVETARRIDMLGNMAHVWSLYEKRSAPGVSEPYGRGINSIQLFRNADGEWRIVQMIWDNEREGVPVDHSRGWDKA